MTETVEPVTRSAWSPRALFSPESGAIASLVVVLVSLSGQNLLNLSISAALGQGFTNRDLTPVGYYLSWAVATVVIVALVILLARPAVRRSGGWDTHVARAAVLLAAINLAAGLLMLFSAIAEANGLWATRLPSI